MRPRTSNAPVDNSKSFMLIRSCSLLKQLPLNWTFEVCFQFLPEHCSITQQYLQSVLGQNEPKHCKTARDISVFSYTSPDSHIPSRPKNLVLRGPCKIHNGGPRTPSWELATIINIWAERPKILKIFNMNTARLSTKIGACEGNGTSKTLRNCLNKLSIRHPNSYTV